MTHETSLPVDPDVVGKSLTAQLSVGKLALVVLGGTLGSLARGWVAEVLESPRIDIATVVVNVSGAFFLGLIISFLTVSKFRSSHYWKLLLGTGFAGGFTTYSAFAFAVMSRLLGGQIWLLVLYGLGTVVVGGLASYLGIVLGTRLGKAAS